MQSLAFLPEDASQDAIIEFINAEAFGPGRHVRAAAHIREQGPHDPSLSFVCCDNGAVVASVRLTPVRAGSLCGHMLGPLAVRPSHKNMGIGGALMRLSMQAAREKGSQLVILVGDPPYYARFGFAPVARGALQFPWPVDPARVMAAVFAENAGERLCGTIVWRPCHDSVKES